MMDTVLNLGLNDARSQGLIARTANERFAWDSYRRFVQMFGNVVRGIDGERFEHAIKERKRQQGRCELDTDLDADDLQALTGRLQADLRGADRRGVPAGSARAAAPGDPRGLRLLERRARGRVPAPEPDPRRLGHGGERAADGVRQQGRRRRRPASRSPATRPPARRSRPATSCRNAQGEDVVSGVRNTPRPRRAGGPDARGPRAADGDHAHARAPLQGHAGRRVHDRGGDALHAPDTQREAAGAGGRAGRRRHGRGGPAHEGGGAARIDADKLDALLHPTFDPRFEYEPLAHGRARLARRRQGRDRLHRRGGGRRRPARARP